ncbi:MAG: FAD-binding oxidoreductase [Yaniella sp.]|nr:FAD-binding oxidoreductase [Yaniella sp.]
MKAIVVGAGLIGLATAFELHKAGLEVMVVERAVVGSGASRGNAGEICPEQATPVAKAGLIVSALSQAYRKDSALHVNLGTLPGYLPFLLRIARNALPRRYGANQAALAEVQDIAMSAFLDLAAEIGLEASGAGYLNVFATEQAAQEGRKATLNRTSGSGIPHTVSDVLGPGDLVGVEPSLNAHGFGFLDEGSYFTNPIKFVETLHQRLLEEGVSIHEGVTVTSVADVGDYQRVHASNAHFDADVVVITAGVGTADIASASGHSVPIKPGKGYSFAIDLPHSTSHIFKFESAHVAGMPLGKNALRIAGTMEFDSDSQRFNSDRIKQIVAAVSPYLPDHALRDRYDEWVGARPLTPDGLPIIGRMPGMKNTYLASGHNMLGLMLSPFTAQVVRDMVLGHSTSSATHFLASRRF